MPDEVNLRPATPEEIADALSFALPYRGRKRVHDSDDAMARLTADRLVGHLAASGFVVMKKPPRASPTTGGMSPGQGADVSKEYQLGWKSRRAGGALLARRCR